MKYWFITIYYRNYGHLDWIPENYIIDQNPIDWFMDLKEYVKDRQEIVFTFMTEITKEKYELYKGKL